jgi:bidirectional [NiFe] hydrogenase diaphorase subunit
MTDIQSVQIVTLTIDGKPVGASGGETILDVAKQNQVYIPTLCHLEGLIPYGACRLCLVEVKGSNRLLPACITKVAEGMEVVTNSEKLQRFRKWILELLFTERNHVCSVCVANGFCELQSLAEVLGMDHVRLPYLHPKFVVDATHDRFVSDNNRCILCNRCVRVCSDIEGAHTLDIMGRGIKARIVSDLDDSWGDSPTCTRCSKCAQVCPTGAIKEKGRRSVGEKFKRRDVIAHLAEMRESAHEEA